MNQEQVSILQEIIRQRRTTKPNKMNGKKIPDAQIQAMLAAADWAPTHGMTEPWRFVVFTGTSVVNFCKEHAAMYEHNTPKESFLQSNYDKLLHMGDMASHIIIAINTRGHLPKIHAWEELAATACAVQNMLLTATAMGIAAYWGSGGMATHRSMKKKLELREVDAVMGILYFGYTDAVTIAKRNIPLSAKVTWY